MADLGFFLRWSLRNLNYTKFNKENLNISTSKKRKKTQIHEILQIFWTNKESKEKKKRLIKDKVQIENVDMRIIKWPQQFHNKSYAISC